MDLLALKLQDNMIEVNCVSPPFSIIAHFVLPVLKSP
jgi:hypothetical protein